jgi:hypothetical protein
MISSCVARAGAQWRWSVIITAQPEADTKLLREFGQSNRSIVDVTDALSGDRPARNIASMLKAACRNIRKERRGLVIGDWLHRVYDEFEIGLEVEEVVRDSVNLVCCYRGEGFWSMDINHLARLFEMHDRIMFGTDVFDRSV